MTETYTSEIYIYFLTALLPLSAAMVLFQANPYHALIVRGVLGSIAATVYGVLGAADVALTEALVGTMLAVTLYAIAVRSSMVMRVGVLQEDLKQTDDDSLVEEKAQHLFGQLMNDLQKMLNNYHMRLELVSYQDMEELDRALMDKEVHTTCVQQLVSQEDNQDEIAKDSATKIYHTKTRVQRLYDIMENELGSSGTILTYVSVTNSGEKH